MDGRKKKDLEDTRRTLDKLYQLYEYATADIAPPIKVLDGMPYSLTNAVNSMTEHKATRMVEISEAIDDKVFHMLVLIKDIEKIRKEEVRRMIYLRYVCCYSWPMIKEKMNTDKTAENIRSTVNYYIQNYF